MAARLSTGLLATVAIISSCAATGAVLGLHALAAARRSLRAVTLTSIFIVASALAGAATGGALGSMRYAAAASWLGALISWWQFRRALHESDTVPVPRWMWPGRVPVVNDGNIAAGGS